MQHAQDSKGRKKESLGEEGEEFFTKSMKRKA